MKNNSFIKLIRLHFFSIFLFINVSFFAQDMEDSIPLLRVFPIAVKEECEWAIRYDICLKCLKAGKKYAQKIVFYKNQTNHLDGPFRIHGCYTDKNGFEELSRK